jgi:WD40 repeat protein
MVEFAPDGKSVATSHEDGLIKFWNVQTLEVALTLQHSHGPASFLSFASDGTLLATKDAQGTVRLWPAPSLREIDANLGRSVR